MSQSIIKKGNLEYREIKHTGSGTDYHVILTHCPICGVKFKAGYHRTSHIMDHSPEEFGLSPMMER